MRCSRCGYEGAQGLEACARCGTPLAAALDGTTTTDRPWLDTLLALMNVASGAVLMLSPLVVVAILPRLPRLPREAMGAMTVAFAISFVVGIILLMAGMGLWLHHPYGRWLQIAILLPGLLSFPCGSVLSILTLLYFFKPGIVALYSGLPLGAAERRQLGEDSTSMLATVLVCLYGLLAMFFLGFGALLFLT